MSESSGSDPLESPMNQTDPAIIDVQIAAGLQREGVTEFLGNFLANLPGGHFRSLIEQLGTLEEPLINPDIYHDSLMAGERAPIVTWHQFFTDVDQAIPESGVDIIKLTRAGEAYYKGRENTDIDATYSAHQEYAQEALPVYRQLRIMGYSHTVLSR